MNRPARGFTLIELMIVVAIIGILASVAIPSFGKMMLRSRTAERSSIIRSIRMSLEDIHLRDGRFAQDWGGGWSGSFGNPNPPAMPSPQKRTFQPGLAGWTDLSLIVQGSTYYQYQFSTWAGPATAGIFVMASGDLDGDSMWSTKQIQYSLTQGAWMPSWEWPLAGQEDDKGPSRTF